MLFQIITWILLTNPHYIVAHYNVDLSSVIVIFANYRDVYCHKTLHNLFIKAHNPDRVFVAFTQELEFGDDDCLKEALSEPYKSKNEKDWLLSNVKVITKSVKDSRGLHLNVYISQLLIDTHDFALKIDTHSDFKISYDKELIELYNRVGDNKAVFSGFSLPIEYQYRPRQANGLPQFTGNTCLVRVWRNGILLIHSYDIVDPSLYKCFVEKGYCKGVFVTGAFQFGRAHFMKDVMYDKHMDFLFFGEEPLYTLRLFTHGYNIYIPSETYVFHKQEFNKLRRYKFYTPKPFNLKLYNASIERYRYLMGLNYDILKVNLKEIDKFGLGEKRSLQQWYEYIGLPTFKKFFFNTQMLDYFFKEPCIMFKKHNGE